MKLYIRDEITNDYIGNFYDVWYNQSTNVLTVKEMNQIKSDKGEMVITEVSESLDLNLKEMFKENNIIGVYGLKNLNNPFSKNLIVDGNNTGRTLTERCFSDVLRQLYGFPQLSILCAKNINEIVVMINGTVRTEGPYIINKNESASDIMRKVYPSFATAADIWEAKDELIRKADPNSSLSYIEAQLDLLTNIVFGMYDCLSEEAKNKISADCPYIEDLRQEILVSSITAIKDIDGCLGEIRKGKTKCAICKKNITRLKKR